MDICHAWWQMSVGVQKAATLSPTSALTPVILNIKLQNLCNLYSYWTFKYMSLYNSVKLAGDQGKASWQMSVAVHQHSLTWGLQVIHLQCFILNSENLDTDDSVSYKQFWVLCNFKVPEHGCLASSHNQVLFLFLVYLNSNRGTEKGCKFVLSPIFFWILQKTGLEEKSKI